MPLSKHRTLYYKGYAIPGVNYTSINHTLKKLPQSNQVWGEGLLLENRRNNPLTSTMWVNLKRPDKKGELCEARSSPVTPVPLYNPESPLLGFSEADLG